MNRFHLEDPRLIAGSHPIAFAEVTVPEAWVFSQATTASARQTQYTFGEPLTIFAQTGDWLHAQSLRDDYCGWLLANQVKQSDSTPKMHSHVTRYAAPITAEADLKSTPVCVLPPDAIFTPDAQQNDYLHIPELGWLDRRHVMERGAFIEPAITARELLGKSYVWGGRSVAGLDCSALAQLCYRRAGHDIPRDADLQARYLSQHHEAVGLDQLHAADLIFLPGHVMLALDQDTIIHASGHHMLVVEERLDRALNRYQKTSRAHDPLSAYRWSADSARQD